MSPLPCSSELGGPSHSPSKSSPCSFSRYNGPNLVLKYDRAQKRLVNIAADERSSPYYALRDRQGNAIGVTACDIDGDGREEIYFLNTNNAFSGEGQVAGLLPAPATSSLTALSQAALCCLQDLPVLGRDPRMSLHLL